MTYRKSGLSKAELYILERELRFKGYTHVSPRSPLNRGEYFVFQAFATADDFASTVPMSVSSGRK
jgi:hypothetical protein